MSYEVIRKVGGKPGILNFMEVNREKQKGGEMFDVMIKNGQVIDGTGNPWMLMDLPTHSWLRKRKQQQ